VREILKEIVGFCAIHLSEANTKLDKDWSAYCPKMNKDVSHPGLGAILFPVLICFPISTKENKSMTPTLPEVINRYLDAYNRIDIPSMLLTMTEDVCFQHFSGEYCQVSTTDKAQFQTLAEHSAELFSSREQIMHEVTYVGEAIQLKIRFRGIMAVEFPNLGLPVGGELRAEGISEIHLRDGLICKIIDRN